MEVIRSLNNFLTFRHYFFIDPILLLTFKYCQMNVPYKVSGILTLTEVISIRILQMRIISAIIIFYRSHPIALQKLSNERSYKFS